MDSNRIEGPDRIIPAESWTTSERDGAVKLRLEQGEKVYFEPVSVPTYFKRIVDANGSRAALGVKRDGKWVKWNYAEYMRDVRNAAKVRDSTFARFCTQG